MDAAAWHSCWAAHKNKNNQLLRRPRGLLKIGVDCIISGRFSFDRSCGRIFIGKSHLI